MEELDLDNPESQSVVSEENSEVVSHDSHAMFRSEEALMMDVPSLKYVEVTEEQ